MLTPKRLHFRSCLALVTAGASLSATAAGGATSASVAPRLLVARVNGTTSTTSFGIYLPSTRRLAPLGGNLQNVGELAFSPLGDRVVTTRQQNTGYGGAILSVKASARSKPRIVAHSDSAAMTPAWSVDGKRLAFVQTVAPSAEAHLVVATVANDGRLATKRLYVARSGSYSLPSWSPDGHRLALLEIEAKATRLDVLDLVTGTSRALVTAGPPLPTSPPSLSRPSWWRTSIVYADHQGIRLLRLDGGTTLISNEPDTINPILSTDGLLAFGTKQGDAAYSLHITGRTTQTLAGYVPMEWINPSTPLAKRH
jgi:WD40-like Beta Propeller Repeat